MKIFGICAFVFILLVCPHLVTPQNNSNTNALRRKATSTALRSSYNISSDSCLNGLPPSFSGNEIIDFRRPGLPDRTYQIYTPRQYNSSSRSSKLVLSFHGWCGDGSWWTQDGNIQMLADQYNYIMVAPDGLGENEGSCNSWSIPGSTTGSGPNGSATTTCNTALDEPNYCYQSCGDVCQNRCSWTQCQDDDVEFVKDLVQGGTNFTNALEDVLCFDRSQIYATGASNGGMMTWNLVQDNRTAPLFRAAAPMIGLPLCGYDMPGTVPVISLVSKNDETVSPSNLPYPGKATDVCIENRDGEGYRFVSSHRITTAFAEAGGCVVDQNGTSFPLLDYDAGSNRIQCKTWCEGDTPFAVDCAFSAGHQTPDFVYQAAFDFFEVHHANKNATN